jgi:hypothetical protein
MAEPEQRAPPSLLEVPNEPDFSTAAVTLTTPSNIPQLLQELRSIPEDLWLDRSAALYSITKEVPREESTEHILALSLPRTPLVLRPICFGEPEAWTPKVHSHFLCLLHLARDFVFSTFLFCYLFLYFFINLFLSHSIFQSLYRTHVSFLLSISTQLFLIVPRNLFFFPIFFQFSLIFPRASRKKQLPKVYALFVFSGI